MTASVGAVALAAPFQLAALAELGMDWAKPVTMPQAAQHSP
ncbi:hypothetical protein [Streptomyces galilaeus]